MRNAFEMFQQMIDPISYERRQHEIEIWRDFAREAYGYYLSMQSCN
jgi:hypothetical protein